MNITAEQIAELLGRMITDSNEAQREIDDLTAQVEALAAERDDLRAKLAAAEAQTTRALEQVALTAVKGLDDCRRKANAEARAENLAKEIVSAIKEMEPAASQLARCGFMMRSDAIRITIDALEAALAQEQPQ